MYQSRFAEVRKNHNRLSDLSLLILKS